MKPGLVGKKRQEVEENEKREKGFANIRMKNNLNLQCKKPIMILFRF